LARLKNFEVSKISGNMKKRFRRVFHASQKFNASCKRLEKMFPQCLKNLANCEKLIQLAQNISQCNYIVRESKSKSRDFPLNEGDDTNLMV
jgi:hypothetical protein